jgi:hypothetical protein
MELVAGHHSCFVKQLLALWNVQLRCLETAALAGCAALQIVPNVRERLLDVFYGIYK